MASFQTRKLGFGLEIGKGVENEKATLKQFSQTLMRLCKLFEQEDCSLCEINPLVVTGKGDIVALDSKINFDSNAAARHTIWQELRDRDEEDPVEAQARQAGLSYVALDGNIGCLVNGAGLAMSTMDIIKHFGGEPANFLDVGGSATKRTGHSGFQDDPV